MRPKNYDFDLDNDTITTALNYFTNKSREPQFETNYSGSDSAEGSGANKQVYMMIANTLITESILLKRGYFADVNPDHDFWLDDARIASFCHFIKCFISNGCKFPYHFAPSLLEVFAKESMSMTDMQFYLDKIDPVVAKTVADTDFTIDTGYDSQSDAYRHLCIGDITSKQKIYHIIRMRMQIGLAKLRRHSRLNKRSLIAQLDNKLSGPYVLTPAMALSCITIHGYQQTLRDFIYTLTDTELRSMLLTFGNTVSLNAHYDIYIGCDKDDVDIEVCVCSRTVWIAGRLLEDPEQLQILKIYFAAADTKIRD